MKLNSFILCAALLGLGTLLRGADGPDANTGRKRIAVVVSQSNPISSLELKELELIFSREKLKWPHGENITVFERPSEHPICGQLAQLVLRKKPGEMAEHWLNLKLTRGLQAPQICHSPTLLKRYLERVKGAIGYVYEDEVDETMKVVRLLLVP